MKNKKQPITKESLKTSKSKKFKGFLKLAATVAATAVITLASTVGIQACKTDINDVHDVYQTAVEVSTDLGYTQNGALVKNFYKHESRDLHILYNNGMDDEEKQSLFDAVDDLNFIISGCNESMKISVLPDTIANRLNHDNVIVVKSASDDYINFVHGSDTMGFYVNLGQNAMGRIVIRHSSPSKKVLTHEILHHFGFSDDYLRPEEEQHRDTIMNHGGFMSDISLNDVKMLYAKIHDKKLTEGQLHDLYNSFIKYQKTKGDYQRALESEQFAANDSLTSDLVKNISQSLSEHKGETINLVPMYDVEYFIDANQPDGRYSVGEIKSNFFNYSNDNGTVVSTTRYDYTSPDKMLMAQVMEDSLFFASRDEGMIYGGEYISPDNAIEKEKFKDSIGFVVRNEDTIFSGTYDFVDGVTYLNEYKIISKESYDKLIPDGVEDGFKTYNYWREKRFGKSASEQKEILDTIKAGVRKIYEKAENCCGDVVTQETASPDLADSI